MTSSRSSYDVFDPDPGLLDLLRPHQASQSTTARAPAPLTPPLQSTTAPLAAPITPPLQTALPTATMPSAAATRKHATNQQIALLKAQTQRCFISGIHGLQTLETGVAYHYRGHFIYSPALNPIEPIPFSTRRGINIVGRVLDSAPRYDADAGDMVHEVSLGALEKSRRVMWGEMMGREEGMKLEENMKKMEKKEKKEKKEKTVVKEQDAQEESDEETASTLTLRAVGSYDVRTLPGEGGAAAKKMSMLEAWNGVSVHGSLSGAALRTSDSLSREALAFIPSSVRNNSNTSLAVRAGSCGAQDLRSGYGETSLRRGGSSTSLADRTGYGGASTSAVGRSSSLGGGVRLGYGEASVPEHFYTSLQAGSSTSLASTVHALPFSYGQAASTSTPDLLRPSSRGTSLAHLSSEAAPDGETTSTALPSRLVPFLRGRTNASITSLPLRSRDPSSTGSDVHSTPAHAHHYGSSYTPHDRALFLADSAPGSRFASMSNTPYPSRPASPLPGLGHPSILARSNANTGLRAVASTSRLHQLLAEEGGLQSPLSEVAEGTYPHLHKPSPKTVPTKQAHTNLNPEDFIDASDLARSVSSLKPVGTGRPRRASLALNEAHNAANPPVVAPRCPLHGDACDGVTVTETWVTQRAKEGTGFKDLYPVVEGAGGRVMVDWMKLFDEEQARRV
jgi:hypothetical protein